MKDNFAEDQANQSLCDFFAERREEHRAMHSKMRLTLVKAGIVVAAGLALICDFDWRIGAGIALILSAEIYLRFKL